MHPTSVFGPNAAIPVAELVADSPLPEIAADKLTALLRALIASLGDLLDDSELQARRCRVTFADGRARTGLLLLQRGDVVAAFVVPASDDGRLRQLLRDLGLDPDQGGDAAEPDRWAHSAGSPFSSGHPDGPPLVDRPEFMWPTPEEMDAYGLDAEDLIPPHWRRR